MSHQPVTDLNILIMINYGYDSAIRVFLLNEFNNITHFEEMAKDNLIIV